ncbi:MAG: carboxypeptidase-like regulatory domain-containing protein [Limisphaerales bacterium]
MINRIANPRFPAARFLPFAFCFFMALCFGAIPVRAGITFTVSPNEVGNTYDSVITLQINGLTNANVLVQKYLDVNSNGVIDLGDLLVQQFQLKVGQANVFTNESTGAPVTVAGFMPGDTSTASNEMTVPLNFPNGDFAQTLVGQYLYRVSSPGFTAVTNPFTVTNAFYSSCLTGAVVYAESGPLQTFTNIPNAIVLLWTNQIGLPIVQAGTVANSKGNFLLRAPPGTYYFAAGKSNFVDEVSTEGTIGLAANSTNTSPFEITLTPATTNITGRVINSAAPANGLGGLSGMAVSTNGYLSLYFTSTNGYFYAPVGSNFWQVPVDPFAAAFQGYLGRQSNQWLNVSNKVVNFTNTLTPVNAIFYGIVSNNLALPMPGVYVDAIDNAGHESVGMTDSGGRYVVGVSAGTNGWTLYISPVDNPGLTNHYAINLPYLQTESLLTNQAVQQNFSLTYAAYVISGTVDNDAGQPIVGAVVFAESTNDQYQAFSAVTDTNGFYSLDVSDGAWTVGVTAASLQSLGYSNVANFPPDQTVSVSAPATTVDFSMLVCGEIEISTTNLPDGLVGNYYQTNISAVSCQNITNWSTAYGITLTSIYDDTNVLYPPGTAIYMETNLIGYLESSFSFGVKSGDPDYAFFSNCTGNAAPYSGGGPQEVFSDLSATVNLTGPINTSSNITVHFLGNSQAWTASPTTVNGSNYTTTLTLAQYPNPISVGNSYALGKGTEVTFSVGKGSSNTVASILGGFHSVTTAGNSIIVAASSPYTGPDNSEAYVQNGAHIGQYYISAYGSQSNNMDGLKLSLNGTNSAIVYGTPTNSGTFNFSVMAEDASNDITVQPLSLFVFPATGLSVPAASRAGSVQSSNTFQMQLTGLNSALNYTVLMATNLASRNWTPVYTINNPNTNVMMVPDVTATDAMRFYRIQISQ